MPPLPMVQPASGAISFEMLAEIAAGATARVDLCRLVPPHPRAGTLVAVKRLHPHIAEDPTFLKQFLDEVRFTYWLRHDNVVEVAGWGTDDQGSYLAVELVQGVSLLRLMKTIFDTGEAFTERMVVYIASRICRGLGAAHSLRAPNGEMLHLVHRDLTPGNVLVGFTGEVKITDFGMAKAKQRLTKTLTGMRKGEPTYMAPEQARSDEIDARADLFSLGVMLFELFAGRRPWIAKSDYEMVQITTREPPADLRELRPKIDRELVSAVNRCLEKEPADRWQSAHEIASRLDEWLTVHGYQEGNEEALGRFVRRNAMRQMRWFERAIAGELSPQRVGRDLPRVPTYTEHTQPRPGSDLDEDGHPITKDTQRPPLPNREGGPRPEGKPAGQEGGLRPRSQPPGRPLVPPRPGGAPADPRSIRAANVVQQLKKLAPPVEPPRARGRRTPTLDEDGDATDVELRIGPRAQTAAARILQGDSDLDDAGEEVPTLVQKGDAKIQALRAEARAKHAAAQAARQAAAKPGYGVPSSIVDEESDQRVTEVKPDELRRSGDLPNLVPIADAESDLPTAPMASGRPNPPAEPPDAPTNPIVPRKARTTPVNIGGPVSQPRRPAPGRDGLQMRQIPPSPDIPPRPFPQGSPGRPTRPAIPAAPAVPNQGRTTARPPPAEQPPKAVTTPDPSRTSNHDDVQVIDRSALQQQQQKQAPLMSEEAVVAEADRLAIEAVRRSEEARAAQLRAERKGAAAKLAGEAAMIAAEAVRMIRGAGLPAAVKRLEDARTLDQNLQTGKIPNADVTASLRFYDGGPTSKPPQPTYEGSTAPKPGAEGGRSSRPPPMAGYEGASASRPPPAGYEGSAAAPMAPSAGAPAAAPIYLSPGVPSPSSPIFAGAAAEHAALQLPPARQSYIPPRAESAPAREGNPQLQSGRQGFLPEAPAPPVDPEAFQARLRPSLLGTQRGALVALVVVGLLVVLVLIVLLAK